MTVSELIAKLQQCKPTDVVIIGYEGVESTTVAEVETDWRAFAWPNDVDEAPRDWRFCLSRDAIDREAYHMGAVVLRMDPR